MVNVLRFNNHVIDVNLNIAPYLIFEDLVYEPLVCSAGILQPEWHDLAVICIFGDKCNFFFVRGVHSNMIIARVSVEEAEELKS